MATVQQTESAIVTWSLALAVALLATSPAAAAELLGPITSIRDGDTFAIGTTPIRLCGIDAPERDEAGYAAAAETLREITNGKEVRCVQVGTGTVCDGRSAPTSYDRIVAQCFVDSEDIAALLVAAGVACDWVSFSGGHYSAHGGRRCR